MTLAASISFSTHLRSPAESCDVSAEYSTGAKRAYIFVNSSQLAPCSTACGFSCSEGEPVADFALLGLLVVFVVGLVWEKAIAVRSSTREMRRIKTPPYFVPFGNTN